MRFIPALRLIALCATTLAASLDSAAEPDECEVDLVATPSPVFTTLAVVSSPSSSGSAFPFSNLVAFGDDHTDNGNGTYEL